MFRGALLWGCCGRARLGDSVGSWQRGEAGGGVPLVQPTPSDLVSGELAAVAILGLFTYWMILSVVRASRNQQQRWNAPWAA
jgi:hypothetical protein